VTSQAMARASTKQSLTTTVQVLPGDDPLKEGYPDEYPETMKIRFDAESKASHIMCDLPKHREATFLRHAAYLLQKAGRSLRAGGGRGRRPAPIACRLYRLLDRHSQMTKRTQRQAVRMGHVRR